MSIYHTIVTRISYPREKIYENLNEINLKELISDGENAIKKISNVSKIAEKAEKVIGNAVEKLKIISSENSTPSGGEPSYNGAKWKDH